MKLLKYLYLSLLALCLQVNAATVTNSLTYYDNKVADSWFTDSTNTLVVPQFNPAIGAPIKAEIYLKLNITNMLAFENLQAVSWANPDFIGNVGVTNEVQISFWGVDVFNLFVTNTFDATGFDGTRDYAGTSGFISTNVVTKTVIFTVDVADVAGYSVWDIVNKNSARTFMRFNTGALVASVYTTSGVDAWIVYTYTNDYNCPDCPKDCDKDKDSDKDKDCRDKDKDFDKDHDKDKDCDKDNKPQPKPQPRRR